MATKVKPCEECGRTKEYTNDHWTRSDYPDELGPPGCLRYPMIRICGMCWDSSQAR